MRRPASALVVAAALLFAPAAAHADWKEGLAAYQRGDWTILTNSDGRPGASSTCFASTMHRIMHGTRRKNGSREGGYPELDGVAFHGLRKTAAVRLAEAGWTPHEIGAVTGHESLAMIEHYTKEARRKVMALNAMRRTGEQE